ncbi:hypothetical protein EVJ58_g9546 [Rhodofomes roseus]|uniref:NAD(P)-binding protein n=1 Tax=Rhodofomes roseus TaxID=34475 RepID=A0A4Y9XV11_9APHY|nr:hypothetical protein EVJ58_g9546 [Rhodofomes roseus]
MVHAIGAVLTTSTLSAGDNVGIGQETIRVLLQHNAKVYMASRSKEKAEEAIEELKKQAGKEAIFLELDLLSFSSIRKAAEEFMSTENELHVLFNNACVGLRLARMPGTHMDDLEFMTNVISPFFFTKLLKLRPNATINGSYNNKLLKPVLQAGRETHPDHHCSIIMVSSSGAYMGTLNLDTFKDGPTRRKMSTTNLYFQTKFANMVIARQYAKRYADQGFISVALNPGNIDTPLHRYTPSWQRAVTRFVLQPVEKGALTQLWASTMPEAVNHNGGFLIPWARVGRCRPEAYDDASREQLYDWLEEQVNLKDK